MFLLCILTGGPIVATVWRCLSVLGVRTWECVCRSPTMSHVIAMDSAWNGLTVR